MASFNKFNQFSEDLLNGVHNFGSNSFKVMLTNTAPVATNALKGDLTDISAGNGYVAGGSASTATISTSSGTAKAVFSDVTFVASGGTIGPFRYAVLYNDTPTSPLKPLVGYWDNGSSVTLNDGDTFITDFDGTTGVLTIA